MGEIVAVGITHYPPLAGRDQTMAFILKRQLRVCGLGCSRWGQIFARESL